MVQQLLAKGANTAAADASGLTAFCRAAIGGHIEILQLLLAAGTNPAAMEE